MILRDSDSRIFDANRQFIRDLLFRQDPDLTGFWGKFIGITQKIQQRLLELALIQGIQKIRELAFYRKRLSF